MAKSLNKAMLIGHLGADPEIRYTPSGTSVSTFRLATNRRVKKDDQWETEADWHRVVAWERLADFASQYLKKGSLVYVEGQIRTRSWEDKDGNKRYTTEIVARDIQALDSKGERSQAETSFESQPPPPEDDVPF